MNDQPSEHPAQPGRCENHSLQKHKHLMSQFTGLRVRLEEQGDRGTLGNSAAVCAAFGGAMLRSWLAVVGPSCTRLFLVPTRDSAETKA